MNQDQEKQDGWQRCPTEGCFQSSTQRDVPKEGNGKINLITSWMYLSDIGYIITDKSQGKEGMPYDSETQ